MSTDKLTDDKKQQWFWKYRIAVVVLRSVTTTAWRRGAGIGAGAGATASSSLAISLATPGAIPMRLGTRRVSLGLKSFQRVFETVHQLSAPLVMSDSALLDQRDRSQYRLRRSFDVSYCRVCYGSWNGRWGDGSIAVHDVLKLGVRDWLHVRICKHLKLLEH